MNAPNPQGPPAVRSIVGLSAASFGALGGCLTLPGTLLPVLVERFGIRLFEAGSMLALQQVGYLLSVIAARSVIERFGMRAALSGALFTSAVGFGGFGMATGWVSGAIMMLVAGLGFGVMEVATNTLLITAGGERRLNMLNFAHLFFGVGSFAAPPIVAPAVAAGLSWRLTFFVAAGLLAAVALGWSRVRIDTPPSDASVAGSGTPWRVRSAQLFALVLGVYVGVELGIGGWLTKYMVSVRSTTLPYAGNVLSLYWLGLAAGRLLLSVLAHRVREQALLLWLAITSTAMVCGALAAASPWMSGLCFAGTGIAFSGIFPVVVALGGRYHAHDAAGVTSVMTAGAALGGILIPWTMSAIADTLGLVVGMALYAGLCGVMALLAAGLHAVLPAEPVARRWA